MRLSITMFAKIFIDVIGAIWEYLTIIDIVSLFRVNKEYYKLTEDTNKTVGVNDLIIGVLPHYAILSDYQKLIVMSGLFKKFGNIKNLNIKFVYQNFNTGGSKFNNSFTKTWEDIASSLEYCFAKNKLLCSNLKTLNLSDSYAKLEDFGISSCVNITSLDISNFKELDDSCIKSAKLSSLIQITSLNLSYNEHINDGLSEVLCSLSNLQSLRLKKCFGLTKKSLTSLNQISTLTYLDLEGSEILDDTNLSFLLISLTKLKYLNLAGCLNITNLGLSQLFLLTNLQSLSLKDCSVISDEGVNNLSTRYLLTFLDLSGCELITENGLRILSSLTNLTDLNLTKCSLNKNKTTKVSSLSNFSNLIVLTIRSCGIQEINFFENLTFLTSVDLRNPGVSARIQYKQFKFLQKLKILSLQSVSDFELVNICECKMLSYLNLKNCPLITDHGIELICSSLNNIEELQFHWSKSITYNSIKIICKLNFLKRLGIYSRDENENYVDERNLEEWEIGKLLNLESLFLPFEFRSQNNSKKGLSYIRNIYKSKKDLKNDNTIYFGLTKFLGPTIEK